MKITKEYLEWSKTAQKAQIDTGKTNKLLAEELNYSRQFVTSVVNGKKPSRMGVARISNALGIAKVQNLEE